MSRFYSLSQIREVAVAAMSVVAMLSLATPPAQARERKATFTHPNGDPREG